MGDRWWDVGRKAAFDPIVSIQHGSRTCGDLPRIEHENGAVTEPSIGNKLCRTVRSNDTRGKFTVCRWSASHFRRSRCRVGVGAEVTGPSTPYGPLRRRADVRFNWCVRPDGGAAVGVYVGSSANVRTAHWQPHARVIFTCTGEVVVTRRGGLCRICSDVPLVRTRQLKQRCHVLLRVLPSRAPAFPSTVGKRRLDLATGKIRACRRWATNCVTPLARKSSGRRFDRCSFRDPSQVNGAVSTLVRIC